MAQEPSIERRQSVFETPYFRLVAKTLRGHGGDPYYAIQTHDYVCVVAMTATGDIPLVRQYRPAVEAMTLELPSGHQDPGETPEDAARRELLEETGYVAGALELLGCLRPDTGRLTNRMWCYFAPDVRPAEGPHAEEAGVEPVLCRPADRRVLLAPPAFDHALHLAVLQLALVRGKLPLEAADG